MEFQPFTEQEISDRKLLPKGDYDFEILDAWEKTSEPGNPMIEVKVRVTRNGSGLTRVLVDYLHAKKPEKAARSAAWWRNTKAGCSAMTTSRASVGDFASRSKEGATVTRAGT